MPARFVGKTPSPTPHLHFQISHDMILVTGWETSFSAKSASSRARRPVLELGCWLWSWGAGFRIFSGGSVMGEPVRRLFGGVEPYPRSSSISVARQFPSAYRTPERAWLLARQSGAPVPEDISGSWEEVRAWLPAALEHIGEEWRDVYPNPVTQAIADVGYIFRRAGRRARAVRGGAPLEEGRNLDVTGY